MNKQVPPQRPVPASGWSGVLDVLCPMHMVLDASGRVQHIGPTLKKVLSGQQAKGASFLDLFRIKRPRRAHSMADLHCADGMKLHLALRCAPQTALKGVIVPLGAQPTQFVVNLSFGISILDAVRDFSLTNTDFAATDLAIEMLYLIEAKTAAMEASQRLNLRLQGAKTEAEQAALTDTLTGLKNRRAVDRALDVLVAGRAPFAVMRIDLDFFKAVNDTYGHAAGDEVLRAVAQVMQEETRDSDLIAREGGDEFTILLPQVRSVEILHQIARRIIDRISEPVLFQGHECRVSASIGMAWVTDGAAVSGAGVLEDADVALYASKRAGRAQQTLYTADLRLSSAAAKEGARPTATEEET